MLPVMHANMVSRTYEDAPRIHGELRTYLRTEYNGDGAAVIAAIQSARRATGARGRARTVRTLLAALAAIPEALSARLTVSGGA